MEKEYKAIDKLFSFREEEFLDKIEDDKKILKTKTNGIKREEISKMINSISKENEEIKEQLQTSVDNLIADYNIRLAYYNKKYYKQGFDDAVTLNKICK